MSALTKARRGALTILAGGPARYSNETAINAHGRFLYHATADWLIEHGFALRVADEKVEITMLGRQRLERENAGIA